MIFIGTRNVGEELNATECDIKCKQDENKQSETGKRSKRAANNDLYIPLFNT
jgi:hypothetical protein